MRRLLALLLLLAPLPAEAKKPPPPPQWAAGEATAEDFRAGTTALNARKADEAVAAFTAVLAAEPACGSALLGLGRAYHLQGKPVDAEPLLQKATASFPDKLDAHIWYGRVLVDNAKAAEGLVAAKSALAMKPTSIDAQRVAQAALLAQKDYKQAHELLAAARAAVDVVAYNCLEGVVYAEEGDFVRAAEMLPKCEGVPDPALYEALKSKVTAAPPPPAAPAP